MDIKRKKELLEAYRNRCPEMGVISYRCKETGEAFLGISKDTKAGFNSTSVKLEMNGNILVSTGSASIFCCGRKLERILPTDATFAPKITVEKIDTDYFVTFDHPMAKEHYLSFVAYVKSDKVFLNRLYPEQSPTSRFPIITGGKLYVYCIKHGLSVHSTFW